MNKNINFEPVAMPMDVAFRELLLTGDLIRDAKLNGVSEDEVDDFYLEQYSMDAGVE